MHELNEFAPFLLTVLKALNDNPVGALVLVCLSALALVAYVTQQRK